MKIKFQDWIETNRFSHDANHLLESSVICYKSGTYTAALIMAYLGFLVILKKRLMEANMPGLFEERDWNKVIRGLRDENKWEEALKNALMMREKRENGARTQDPIFVINDNVRDQISYWRGRRNDCAHNRDNAILSAHVESFYSFLESNLQKITIEGGAATLLNKFKRHYDSAYTPTNEDISPLLLEIKSAVEKSEMPEFWSKLFDTTNDLIDYGPETDLIRKILKLNEPEIVSTLIDYIKTEKKLMYACMNIEPSLLVYFNLDKQEIRHFWRTKIASRSNGIGIFAMMLRNKLIPEQELDDAMQQMARMLKYTNIHEDHLILASKGFGEYLYQVLFVHNNGKHYKYWKFMNSHYGVYTQFIRYYPLREEVVQVICQQLSNSYSPWFLRESLDNLFNEDFAKKLEFIEVATRLGLELPSALTSLAESE